MLDASLGCLRTCCEIRRKRSATSCCLRISNPVLFKLAAFVVTFSTRALAVASVSANDDGAKFWQFAGKDIFLSLVTDMGCDECAFLAQIHDEKDMVGISSQLFGCADVDVLLPSLHWIYEAARRRAGGSAPGLLIDGGANVGRATARWMAVFGDAFGRKLAANATHAHCIICAGSDATAGGGAAGAAAAPPTVAVIAVEPSPSNFALLENHANENGWGHEGYVALNVALGDKSGEGTLAFSQFYAIDEVATLVYDNSDPRPRMPVKVLTIADVVEEGLKQIQGIESLATSKLVFLLKLDIEGMEPAVLRSLIGSSVRIKFIIFEYSTAVWRENLEDVISDLQKGGFFCFLITPDKLVPVSPPFWHFVYKIPVWSNAFCGHAEDPDLASLVQLHAGSVGLWPMIPRTYLEGYAGGQSQLLTYNGARQLCVDLGTRCAGITCDCSVKEGTCGRPPAPIPGPCTVRAGKTGAISSPMGEVSFMRDPEASELFLLYRRELLRNPMKVMA